MVKLSILAAALLATAGAVIAGPISVSPFNVKTKRVTPIFGGDESLRPLAAPITGDMHYSGGPLLTGKTNVFYIYYGKGFGATDKTYLETLMGGISAHPYFESSKSFYAETNGKKEYIKGPVIFSKAIVDNYSLGKSLTDAIVQKIVTNHINAGDLPLDVNAIYFVLTAPDVQESSGFCTQYCGWHNNFNLNGNDIKFSFVGNPASCLAGCSPSNVDKSPHGNPGVDGMPSIIIHELVEAMSDPDPASGWTDATGYENADKCAYVYGKEITDPATGGKYNTEVGQFKYLIQQNWDLNLNGCYNHPVKAGAARDTGNSTSTTPAPKPKSSSAPVPKPKSTSVTPVPVPTTDTTSSSKGVPTPAPGKCKNGSDKCILADGAGHYYNECINGAWVKKDCRKTTGYPNCYKSSETDIYCQ